MDRSPRFRVYPHALDARFRLAFASAPDLRPLTSRMRSNSPDHNAKGTPSPASVVRRRGSGSDRLYAHGFRFCFTRRQAFFSPFPHGTGPLSVTDSYLALEDGPPGFSQGSTCPGLLGVRASRPTRISHTGLSPSAVVRSSTVPLCFGRPPTRPHNPRPGHPVRVWALPFSLAATLGISIDFFSSRYLDVSVPWVGSLCKGDGICSRRVAPFGHPRISACLQLPGAYRSLPRPSSPVCAKASAVRASSLDQPLFLEPNAEPRLASVPRSAAQLGQSTVAFPTRTLLARPSSFARQAGVRGVDGQSDLRLFTFLLPLLSRILTSAPSSGRRPKASRVRAADRPPSARRSAEGRPPAVKRTALEGKPSWKKVNTDRTRRFLGRSRRATPGPEPPNHFLRGPSGRPSRMWR